MALAIGAIGAVQTKRVDAKLFGLGKAQSTNLILMILKYLCGIHFFQAVTEQGL